MLVEEIKEDKQVERHTIFTDQKIQCGKDTSSPQTDLQV